MARVRIGKMICEVLEQNGEQLRIKFGHEQRIVHCSVAEWIESPAPTEPDESPAPTEPDESAIPL